MSGEQLPFDCIVKANDQNKKTRMHIFDQNNRNQQAELTEWLSCQTNDKPDRSTEQEHTTMPLCWATLCPKTSNVRNCNSPNSHLQQTLGHDKIKS